MRYNLIVYRTNPWPTMKNIMFVKPKSNRYLLSKDFNKIKYTTSLDLAYKSGLFAKEDSYVFNNISNNIKEFSSNELKNLINETKQKINLLIKNFGFTNKEGSFFLFCSYTNNLTKKILKELRLKNTELSVYKNELAEKQKESFILPYVNKTVTTSENLMPYLFNNDDTFFNHLREKLKTIIGENVQSDFLSISKKCDYYSNFTCKDLIKEKFKILQIFSNYLNTENSIKYKYTKDEISSLRLYAHKYDAINHLLEKTGIETKSIEKILFSGLNSEFKEGDILPNGEQILYLTKTYDKNSKKNIQSVIMYCNTDIGQRFRIYNSELITKLKSYVKNFMSLIEKGDTEQINLMNKQIDKLLKNIKIAEVYLESLNKEEMENRMRDSNLFSEETINDLTKNKENFYFVKNLKNFNIKKYYNVAPTLVKYLKEFVEINKIDEVYLEALSFNNINHSPAALYLKMGATPITISAEELRNRIYEKTLDYKENIWFKYTP